jgi:hypothetical protein
VTIKITILDRLWRWTERDKRVVVSPWSFRGFANEFRRFIHPWMRRSYHEAVAADKACLKGIAREDAAKDLVS